MYVIGNNLPGYMPDDTPYGELSWDDATLAYLADVRRAIDEASESLEPSDVNHHEEYRKLCEYIVKPEAKRQLPINYHVDGRVYWLTSE